MAQRVQIYHDHNKPDLMERLAQALKEHQVFIYKTDTMYALGCALHSQRAVERICAIKGVKLNKNRFSFICSDLSHISDYAKVDNLAFKTLKRYLPGPYTFVLPASRQVPSILCQGKKTVGVRIPDYEPILELVKTLGQPLLTASLPQEGLDVEEYTDPDLILDRYAHAIDYLLDGGVGGMVPSSVIEIKEDGFEVLREGLGDCQPFYD